MGLPNDGGCFLSRVNGSEPALPPPPVPSANGFCLEGDERPQEEAANNGHSAHLDADEAEDAEVSADMVAAVKVLLNGLGEDIRRCGLAKTPVRVARAFSFATKGYHQLTEDIVGGALFPEAGVEAGFGCGGGFGGLVVVRNIDLFSMCEACLLPFKVCFHVGYISSGRQVVGLSKLSRVADVFARRLQSPQRLAEEITEGLSESIRPLGVAVVVQCLHLPVPGLYDDENLARLCSADEMHKPTFNCLAGTGSFHDRSNDVWNEFLEILELDGIILDRFKAAENNGFIKKAWCPCSSSHKGACGLPRGLTYNGFSNGPHENGIKNHVSMPSETGDNSLSMLAAAKTILNAIGVDMSDEELLLTPKRFVKWLLNFRKRSQESDLGAKWFERNAKYVGSNGHTYKSALKADLTVTSTINGNSFIFELDAPFCSLCEHHLLPFYGKAHIAYFEAGELIGRSAILSIIKALSQRLQIQERLTRQIAETIICKFNVQSIAVVVEASHICMVSRGVEKLGSSTATVAVFGRFATDAKVKLAFLKEINSQHVKRTCA